MMKYRITVEGPNPDRLSNENISYPTALRRVREDAARKGYEFWQQLDYMYEVHLIYYKGDDYIRYTIWRVA